MKKLEKRMYFLTLYNISPIQQGIQPLHSVIEHCLLNSQEPEFVNWAKRHKTVIILNGGTSNDGKRSKYGYKKKTGSMENHLVELKKNKIKCSPFYEPDINWALTGIAFLVDERVFTRKKYPDFEFTYPQFLVEKYKKVKGDHDLEHEILLEHMVSSATHVMKHEDDYFKEFNRRKSVFIETVGKDVAFLKDFTSRFRLA